MAGWVVGRIRCLFGFHDFSGARRVQWCRRPGCFAKLLRPL